MRTTLTIDNAILKALKDLAHRLDRPFKDVVNETLRAGLSRQGRKPPRHPFALKTYSLGGPVGNVNLDKALELADRIEEVEILQEARSAQMIVVDVNLLIYAVNKDSPNHEPARIWFERILSGEEELGFAWVVLLAFLRLTTRPGILSRQLSVDEALATIDSWLKQPCATLLTPGPSHWPILRTLLSATGTAGNLCTDAHLAALAVEHNATICSADHDFLRFPGVTFKNPLA